MNRSSWLVVLMLASSLTACGERAVFGSGRDGGAIDASGDGGPRLDTGMVAMLDGATDVGAGDVGAGDVGAGDAGSDASMSDAMFPGGGTSDAALPDGGMTDGGPHLGPAPVDLGSPSDLASAAAYALIGKTGITNVIGTMISGGHLGVSPVTSTAITGFSLILDSSGEFSTSPSVIPPARVYAADYAVPTPSNLTSAILSMERAYSDAASRTLPDFLDLSSGAIGGLALVPGLYTWGSGVTITADVTLLGGANDVWIFQITNDLDLSANIRITLAGGAEARNVFWQVAGQVTMHADAHFEGNILCQTGITMQTRASMHGRALAQTLVALDDNAITAP